MGSRMWRAGVVAAVAAAALVVLLDVFAPGYLGRASAAGTPVLRVGGPLAARPVAAGFLGLSVEYSALTAYAGHDPSSIDPVFVQLMRNLAPGQRPVLRIGGDSTDHSWVPVRGMATPPGVHFDITPIWLAVAGALTRALNARVIPGIDLEANSARLAGAEARAMVLAIGRRSLQALELGNEPELYGSFSWYQHDGHGVPGRPASWNVSSYLRDLPGIVRALPKGIALAAPATGHPSWMAALGQIVHAEPRVAVATVHRYPLNRCFTPVGSPHYPTIPNLLRSASSAGLADTIEGFARTAHAHHLTARVDEFNSVSCRGKRGVSDTFASALWGLDGAFAMARAGADGINVHTLPGASYQLFRFSQAGGTWQAVVAPEYYGLMMFAQAAPADSRLLAVTGVPGSQVRSWATRARDGAIHVVLINEAANRAHSVTVNVPGASGPADLERLQAPGLAATSGVTLGGQSFGDENTTGLLAGPPADERLAPVGGRFEVQVPAASAAMLTVP